MSLFRLFFAGEIKKSEFRQMGNTPICEVSICKKNYAKEGAEATFTWVKVIIRQPTDWQSPKLIKGAFIAGSGEMSARSFEGKEGKQHTIEVRCTGYDIEFGDRAKVSEGMQVPPNPVPVKADHAKAAAADDDEAGVPF